MIKNKYLIMGAIVLMIPFTLAWSFNHINPWLTFGLAFLLILGVNQYFKNKNK
jgi:hypothetical protein